MFNADLLDDLAREKAVLFLGAGVSASAKTSTGGKIADWNTFLAALCNDVPEPIASQVRALIQAKDYLLAGEILQSALADGWESKITEHFGQKATPSALHASLIALSQRIILTTNFDKLLEVAFEKMDIRDTHYPTVINKVEDDVFRALKDHNRKYIVKIHGTVDDPSSRVLSRSEYIRLAFGNSYYSSFLENLLLNYTFLFVGFSMDDPAIMSLMEMYSLRYPKARPHYIFAGGPIPENIIEINKRLRKLIYIVYDSTDNHAALPGLITDIAIASDARRREIFAEHQATASPKEGTTEGL
ncbi:SIR2 family protein [Bradyrhizobium sp. HKCCYLR20261]|uniref:SIR2 family protein n=1 Tax=Bradyrhizobium sp. HKCCYLR20261 TaxID=3420760 RepID=UPI003EB9E274